MFYGFNSRMIPDDLHSRPVYRRLVPRTEDELKNLEIIRKKLEALNNKKKRLSKSVEVSKKKPV